MSEEIVAAGPIRPASQADRLKFRERADRDRTERHERAASAAAGLFRAAAAERSAAPPVWVRAVTLLMEAIRADYATVMIVQGSEARCCRITRGQGLEERPSRRWPTSPPAEGPPGRTSTRVEIERLPAAPASATLTTQSVPGATSSFHAFLYVRERPQPVGCLSLHASTDLALAADRVAFIDAVAELLARELVASPLPHPSPA